MATTPIDIQIRTRGLSDLQKLERRMEALERDANKLTQTLPKASNDVRRFGNSAKGASGKIGKLTSSITKLGKAGLLIAGVAATLGAIAAVADKYATFSNELDKTRQALANIAGPETTAGLLVIDDVINRFGGKAVDVTKNFTGLQAAVSGAGGELADTVKVFKALTAANVALGGSQDDLNGILLAAQQVFSKGKVSAEELRGQIGERLPGAFGLFAKATGRSTAELDKALQQGEVNLQDFVTFAESLFEKYEKDAEALYNGPNNAAQRLSDSLNKFNTQLGVLLKPIDTAFKNLFSGILSAATSFITQLNSIFGLGIDGAVSKATREFEASFETVSRLQKLSDEGKGGNRLQQQLVAATAKLNQARTTLQAAQAEARKAAGFNTEVEKTTGFDTDLGCGGGTTGSTKAAKASSEAEKILTEQLKKKAAAVRLVTNAYDKQQSALAEIEAENTYLQNTITYGEKAANKIREINRLVLEGVPFSEAWDAVTLNENLQKGVDKLGEFNNKLTEGEELLNGAYSIVTNELTDSIGGLIDGTKEWGDVLSDIAGQLGKMFLNAGFSALGGSLGIPGFAEGGRPPVGEVSIIGEKGPELWVPDSAGTVLSNQDSKAALSNYGRMSPEQQKSADKGEAEGDSSSASFNYSPQIQTTRFGDTDFVSVDQMNQTVAAGMAQATKEGAKIGEAQALRRLRMNPSVRRQVGI